MTGLNGWNSIGEIFSYLPLQVINTKSFDRKRTSDTELRWSSCNQRLPTQSIFPPRF